MNICLLYFWWWSQCCIYRNICLLISSVKHTFTFLANLRHFFLQRGTWCPAPGIKWGREMLNLSDLYLFLFSSRRSYAGQPEGRFQKKKFQNWEWEWWIWKVVFFALFVTIDYSASDWVDNSNTEIWVGRVGYISRYVLKTPVWVQTAFNIFSLVILGSHSWQTLDQIKWTSG